jgi:SPP1 gp7 family putative phage head morphogenesis protein
MSANTFLVDAATRHAVFVQRFAGGESKKAQAMITRLLADVNSRLLREPTEFQASRLSSLRSELEFLMLQFSEKLDGDMIQMSLDFAQSEAAFSAQMMSQVSTVPLAMPTDAALSAAVLRQGMDTPLGPDQVTVQQALNQFSRNKSREIMNAINDGVLVGKTTRDIANDVSQLSTRQRRQVDTLTRTIVNHVSAQARNVTLEDNADILEGYEWVSTLDSRTTLICGGRDGRIYPVGQGPRPPAHWNCRSTVIPVVREEFRIEGLKGERPAVGDDGPGVVSAKSTYGGWLKKQPSSFQDETLGPTRAKLFRDGGLTIDKFRDETGKTYTLEQLKQLEPLAFERASVELD